METKTKIATSGRNLVSSVRVERDLRRVNSSLLISTSGETGLVSLR